MSADRMLAPTDLRDFLKSRGWTLIEDALKDRLYAFQHPLFERRSLMFPMDLEAPDYAESVANALAKLAEMTGETAASLRARAQSARDDVVRLRVYSRATDDALPLSFAAAMVHNTVKLLKAAACTVLRPRVHHPKLSLGEATALVDTVRFAHTEEGSFILRVACPLDALQGSLGFDNANAEPFVRQVTSAVQRSLLRLTDAIEADRLDALVDELKTSGTPSISANLCEAVAGMHDEVLGNSLDVSVDWSALRAVSDPALLRPVRIQRDYFVRIAEVHQELRSVARYAEGPFFGTVEALNGSMGEDGRRSGEAILSLLLPDEDEVVRAKVILSADDYATADRAHMNSKALVRISGHLLSGRQPRWLAGAANFEIVPE